MGIIFYPRKSTRKPATYARLNGNHPLAQGLTGLWLFNDGGTARELLTGLPGVHTAQTWTNSDNGLGLTNQNTTNTTGFDCGAPWANLSYASGTIVFRVFINFAFGDSLQHMFCGQQNTGSTTPEFDMQKYSDNTWYCGWNTGADYRVHITATAANTPQSKWSTYILTWSSAGSNFFLNGANIGTNGTAPTVANVGFNWKWMNCAQAAQAIALPNGTLFDMGAIYNRVLSSAEIQMISTDSYCMLQMTDPWKTASSTQRINLPENILRSIRVGDGMGRSEGAT